MIDPFVVVPAGPGERRRARRVAAARPECTVLVMDRRQRYRYSAGMSAGGVLMAWVDGDGEPSAQFVIRPDHAWKR